MSTYQCITFVCSRLVLGGIVSLAQPKTDNKVEPETDERWYNMLKPRVLCPKDDRGASEAFSHILSSLCLYIPQNLCVSPVFNQCSTASSQFIPSLWHSQLTPRPHAELPFPPRCQATGEKRSFCNKLDTVCLPSLDPYLLLFLLIDPSIHPF